MADLKKMILSAGGSSIIPAFGSRSTLQCFRKGNEYKMLIELTFPVEKDISNLKQVGEIVDPKGHVLNEEEIKDQHGWIYFPKEKGNEIQTGKGAFVFDGKDHVTLNLSLQLKDSGKTQSGV